MAKGDKRVKTFVSRAGSLNRVPARFLSRARFKNHLPKSFLKDDLHSGKLTEPEGGFMTDGKADSSLGADRLIRKKRPPGAFKGIDSKGAHIPASKLEDDWRDGWSNHRPCRGTGEDSRSRDAFDDEEG